MRPGAGEGNSNFFSFRHQKVQCLAEIALHFICIPADACDELDHVHIEFGLDFGIRLEGLQQILRPRGEGAGLGICNLQFKLRPKRQHPVGAELRVHFLSSLAGLKPSWPRTVSAILGKMDLSCALVHGPRLSQKINGMSELFVRPRKSGYLAVTEPIECTRSMIYESKDKMAGWPRLCGRSQARAMRW